MRAALRFGLAFVAAALPVSAAISPAIAQDANAVAAQQARLTNEQLDNLVAPIALYPDAILAQVLIAATYPEQVQEAARYVKANGTRGVDDQSWDVSVKSVAHYAPVLNMLAERDDWATAVGQAYAQQSGDVMDAVQRLRQMAKAQGNLVSTPQQRVVEEQGNIQIVPAQPTVIYVPTYDPYLVYYEPIFFGAAYRTAYWSFGIGFPIGGWLTYDCDWYGRTVFYDGWYGGGWRAVSRPFISINVIYTQPRYRHVDYNREVIYRPVRTTHVEPFRPVHRDAGFPDRRGGSAVPPGVQRQAFGGGVDRGARNDPRNDPRTDPRNDPRYDPRRQTFIGRIAERARSIPPMISQRRAAPQTHDGPQARSAPQPSRENRGGNSGGGKGSNSSKDSKGSSSRH